MSHLRNDNQDTFCDVTQHGIEYTFIELRYNMWLIIEPLAQASRPTFQAQLPVLSL